MPYSNYVKMSDEDLASVITHIRSIPAVRQAQAPQRGPLPVNRFINAVPQPIAGGSVPTPDLSTAEKRGAYLATLASCADCHTPMDERGQFIQGWSSPAAALSCTRGASNAPRPTSPRR